MDDEHSTIFQFVALIGDCRSHDMACLLLSKLADVWRVHIQDEEVSMEELQYPYLLNHRREHQKMDKALVSLVALMQVEAGKQVVTHYTKKFEDVFRHHVDHIDRQFAEYALRA